jgi:Uma2 family endonuclease
MSAVAEKTLITPEEFLRMPDRKEYELIDGELVPRYGDPRESRVSALSSWVGANLVRRLGVHVEENQLGWVFGPDKGLQCFSDRPGLVRFPDVSLVRSGRMGRDQLDDGWLRIVPDLVVEVISPNDKASELDEKVELFLKAGVPLIWIVSPKVRTVRIIRGDGSTAILRDSEELSSEDIIPGFVCAVSSIFPPKSPDPAPDLAPKS